MLLATWSATFTLRLATYRRRNLFAFNHRSGYNAESRVELHLSGSYEHSDGSIIARTTQLNLTLGIAGNNQSVNVTAG
jgi:hypothetical protein